MSKRLTLRSGMHKHFGNHPCEEEAKKTPCEFEVRPVMPVLQHLQRIALEIHRSVKVHLVEGLQWDLVLPAIRRSVLFIAKMQVAFHWPPRITRFFVFTRRYR